MIIINNISRGRRDFITTNSSLAMIILNINNNNIARAKLIRAVIIIINKGKTSDFFLPLINIITVRVVHTICVYCICIRLLGFPTGQLSLNLLGK